MSGAWTVREVKTCKKWEGSGWSVWNPPGFANWRLSKVSSYLYTETDEQGPYVKIWAGSDTKFLWWSWVFSVDTLTGTRIIYGCCLKLLDGIVVFIQAFRGGDILKKRAQGNLTAAWSRKESLLAESLKRVLST